jgi:hypothetical protein
MHESAAGQSIGLMHTMSDLCSPNANHCLHTYTLTAPVPLPASLLQWLRPKVLYNYGVNISAGDGSKRPFLFREHSLFNNTK